MLPRRAMALPQGLRSVNKEGGVHLHCPGRLGPPQDALAHQEGGEPVLLVPGSFADESLTGWTAHADHMPCHRRLLHPLGALEVCVGWLAAR